MWAISVITGKKRPLLALTRAYNPDRSDNPVNQSERWMLAGDSLGGTTGQKPPKRFGFLVCFLFLFDADQYEPPLRACPPSGSRYVSRGSRAPPTPRTLLTSAPFAIGLATTVGVAASQRLPEQFFSYSTFGPPIASEESAPTVSKSFATFKAPPVTAPPTISYDEPSIATSPQTVKYFNTGFFLGHDSSSAAALVPSLAAVGLVAVMAF